MKVIIIMIVAVVSAMTGFLFSVFYLTAANSNPQIMPMTPPGFGNFTPPKPPIGNYTGPDGLPANITHKIVIKYGWYPCQEDPGVWCHGKHKVNETIITQMPFALPGPGFNNNNITPPSPLYP